jgi:hypothetical protein
MLLVHVSGSSLPLVIRRHRKMQRAWPSRVSQRDRAASALLASFHRRMTCRQTCSAPLGQLMAAAEEEAGRAPTAPPVPLRMVVVAAAADAVAVPAR